MKQKFIKTKYLGILLASSLFCACTKSTDLLAPLIPPRVNENPVFSQAFKQDGTGDIRPAFNLASSATDYPTEYGIEFSSAKKGVLYAVGFRLPEPGKYYVSLWDAATKNLILRDSVDYTDPSKFIYKDFSAKNQSVNIERDKKYMASVYVPRSAFGAPRNYYTLLQPGVSNWVPFTSGSISITGNYYKKENFPVYPDVLILHPDVLNGLVDIGFYKTEF